MSLLDQLGIDVASIDPEKAEKNLDGGPLPEGKYHALLTGAKSESFKSGNSGFEFEFEVLAPDEHAGRKVHDRLVISEKTEPRQIMYLSRLGIIEAVEKDGKKHYEKGEVEDFIDAIGTEVVIEVAHEEFQREKGGKGIAAKVTFGGVWRVDDERVKDVPKADSAAVGSAKEKSESQTVADDDLDDL